MRRPAVATMSTISGLVLMFGYHTSQAESATPEPAAAPTAPAAEQQGSAAPDLDPTPATDAGTEEDELDPGDTEDSETDGSTATRAQTPTANPTPKPSATSGAGNGSAEARTYLGEAVSTHFGPVQVQITVAGGRITAAEATQVPMNNGHDVRINSYAVPILNAAAVEQQSARLDGVSGATITSGAYRQSLQSAIDAAGL